MRKHDQNSLPALGSFDADRWSVILYLGERFLGFALKGHFEKRMDWRLITKVEKHDGRRSDYR
jgi:hypothetical protein